MTTVHISAHTQAILDILIRMKKDPSYSPDKCKKVEALQNVAGKAELAVIKAYHKAIDEGTPSACVGPALHCLEVAREAYAEACKIFAGPCSA